MDVETMLVAIRGAFANEAPPDAKLAGTAACRALLLALEPPQQQVQLNASTVASAVAALRGVPSEQLLDLAIAKLRSSLPAGVEVQAAPVKFNLVTVPMAHEWKSP